MFRSMYLVNYAGKRVCSPKQILKQSRHLLTTQTLASEKKQQGTVNKADVELHSKLMNHWWDEFGAIKALHSMNHLRVPFIRDGLVNDLAAKKTLTPLAGMKILDIGCGGGILSEPLARLGAQVTGVDASEDLIKLAQEHSCKDDRLAGNLPNYICTTIEDHSQSHTNYYDGVVASEVLEHVENKELFMKSCIQTLKPGGRIFITVPTRTRLSQFAGIFVAEYILNIVPRGTHQHEKFPTPNEVTFLMEKNDCHVEIIQGAVYNILTNKWKFIESQALLIFLQAVKERVD